MFSLTISRYRRQLLCTALFSALMMAGCTVHDQPAGSGGQNKTNTLIQQYQRVIDAAAGSPSVTAVRAFIAQEPLLADPDTHQQNIDGTWQMLTRFTADERNNIQIKADETTLQGWIDLLILYQSNQQDMKNLHAAVSDWQTRYPENPAAKTLPQDLIQVMNTGYMQNLPSATGKNARVALFLPLSGQAKLMGDAIRQGFTDARNSGVSVSSYQNNAAAPAAQAPAEQAPVAQAPAVQPAAAPQPEAAQPVTAQAPLSPADPDRDITVPDSANGAPSNDYHPDVPAPAVPLPAAPQPVTQQAAAPQPAVADATTAASPVIAAQPQQQPYSGESSSVTDVKVYDTDSQPLPALIAQAQADGVDLIVGPLLKTDVATLANSNTTMNVLALNELDTPVARPNVCYFSLSPEDEARNAARFIRSENKSAPLILTQDNSFGRRVAQSFADEWQKAGGGTVLHQTIAGRPGSAISLSGVPVMTAPPQAAQDQTGGMISQPQPQAVSGSVDSVYIIATSDELTYIKPMLELGISARGRPAFYASSRSNKAGTGKDFQFEMEGLKLTEIPLIAGSDPALLSRAAGKFGGDFTRVRLYAMGMDAWRLANQYGDMQRHTLRLNGASGDLTITDNCTVFRQLPWLIFRQGNLVPVGSAQ